jgi:UDP-2-acetamido-3-amino-2,3-dideoxy-glucuronate N-acetyltransferase
MTEIVQNVGKNVKLGRNVRIWHFTYIGDNTEIGDDTKIGSLVHIDYNVKIGKRCKIEGSTYIPPLTVIEDDVFIGPGVIFTNDPFPTSTKMIGVIVKKRAVICAGSMLKAGIKVGKSSVVGFGSVVTKDVASETVVFGNPAKPRYNLIEYLKKKKEWETR